MVLNQKEVVSVMLSSLQAMAKIFIICAVGYACAKYPRESPYLSIETLKLLARLCNFVLIPPLIVSSIGSSISLSLLGRMGILILFSFISSLVSYTLAKTIGRGIIGSSCTPRLKVAIEVAIGSPNIIAFPLMILQTLCSQDHLKGDYDNNSDLCFAEGTSMLFVYSIGWNLVYWSYGYPLLSSLHSLTDDDQDLLNHMTLFSKISAFISSDRLVEDTKDWGLKVLLSRNMLAIYTGIFIGA